MEKKENIKNAIIRQVNNNPKVRANIIIGQLAFRYSESQDCIKEIIDDLKTSNVIEIINEDKEIFITKKTSDS